MKKMILINNLITKLLNMARNGIIQHYDATTNLFGFIVTDNIIKREKKRLLLVHSLISLLGISNHKDSIGIDYRKSVNKIFNIIENKENGIWEYSLLLWLLAKENDLRAEKIFKYIIKIPEKIICHTETMGLAWMLTALTFEFRRNNNLFVESKLIDVAQLLNKRFIKKTRFFLHRDKKNARWDIRYNIANFADQAYSIYALSMYTHFTKDERYLETLNLCGRKISSFQGKKGQWWWHYNALTGSIIQKYPVFSVHQDSIAPFALMALSDVSNVSYNSNISLGLRWISKENELEFDMINEDRNFVRRGIGRNWILSKIQKLTTVASNFNLTHGMAEKYDQPKYLKVINWEHSYHLGWILYAYNEENKYMWSKL